MTVVIYGPTYSTYTRTARLALEEKGVAYRLHEVDTLGGEGPETRAPRAPSLGEGSPCWITTDSPCLRRWRSPATWTKPSLGRRYSPPTRGSEREWRKSVPCVEGD